MNTIKFKRVILESPYKGNIQRNLEYGRRALRDSLSRGEAPIASHLLYTQEGVLNDDIQDERKWGIDAGLSWKEVADIHVFYIDYGISQGMTYGMDYAKSHNIIIEMRKIGENTSINNQKN
ncbi:MAG: hypothetical protein N2B06_16885 [Clostridium sp.]